MKNTLIRLECVDKMNTYTIPVYYMMAGTHEIEADSLEHAIKMASVMGLPNDAQYVSGSYQVDEDLSANYAEFNNA